MTRNISSSIHNKWTDIKYKEIALLGLYNNDEEKNIAVATSKKSKYDHVINHDELIKNRTIFNR